MSGRHTSLVDAIREARGLEKKLGSYHYVVACRAYWSEQITHYEITDRMPMLGEWYDTGGIRHG